jgi:methyl-accepting chemotaxis protein
MDFPTDQVTDLVNDLDDFIAELRRLHVNPLTIDRLERLTIELGTPNPVWNSANLYQAFNLPMLLEEARTAYEDRSRIINFIDVARNVLVLLPIVLTWHALSNATSAYHKAVSLDETLLTVPFLLQWEQGFSGHLGNLFGYPLTFSNVAFLDVVLVSLVVIATLAVQWKNSVQTEKADQKAVDLAARFEDLLWRLDELYKSRMMLTGNSPEHRSLAILETVAKYVDEFQLQGQEMQDMLAAEQEHLKTLAEYRQRETQELQNFSSQLKNSITKILQNNQQLAKIITKFDQTADAISEGVFQVGQSVTNLNRTMTSVEGKFEQFQNISVHLNQQLQGMAMGLESTLFTSLNKVEDLSKQVTLISNQSHQLAEGQMNFQAALNKEHSLNAAWLNSVQESAQHITLAAQSIAVYTAQMEKAEQNLAQMLASAQETSSGVFQSASRMSEWMDHLETISSGLERAANGSEQTASQIGKFGDGFLHLSEEIYKQNERSLESEKNLSVVLHELAKDMSHFRETLTELSPNSRHARRSVPQLDGNHGFRAMFKRFRQKTPTDNGS